MDLKKMFMFEVYEGKKAYLKARKADYCKVQFEWACFIDNLCRDGEITEKEYNNALF